MSFWKTTKEDLLIKAAKKKQPMEIARLLADGASIEKVAVQAPDLLAQLVLSPGSVLTVDALIHAGLHLQKDAGARALHAMAKSASGNYVLWHNHKQSVLDFAKMLLGSGVEVLPIDGKTALHYAAGGTTTDLYRHKIVEGHCELAALLLKRDPDIINIRDNKGNTALHYALIGGEKIKDMVRLLHKSGADAHIADNKGKTPLDQAYARDLTWAVNVLKNGIDDTVEPKEESPAPAPLPPEWVKLDDQQIARVRTVAALGYKLTDIFNFATRECLSLSKNLESNAESRETRKFDDMTHDALDTAHAAYKDLGGTLPLVKDKLGKSLSA